MDRRCPRGTLSGPRGPLATPGPARGSLGTLGMVFTTLLFFLTTIQNPENPEGYTASPSLSCPSIQPPAPQRPGAARVDGSKVNVRTHPRPASPQPSVAALPPRLALAPPALCPGVIAVGQGPGRSEGRQTARPLWTSRRFSIASILAILEVGMALGRQG